GLLLLQELLHNLRSRQNSWALAFSQAITFDVPYDASLQRKGIALGISIAIVKLIMQINIFKIAYFASVTNHRQNNVEKRSGDKKHMIKKKRLLQKKILARIGASSDVFGQLIPQLTLELIFIYKHPENYFFYKKI
ncbi:hypothetical protein ACJX0J_010826, partial [Zea mays]